MASLQNRSSVEQESTEEHLGKYMRVEASAGGGIGKIFGDVAKIA
jgi:hypothetical protein